MVGDHLAMDLLNTRARTDGAAIEFWHSGEDVLRWLARHEIALPMNPAVVDRVSLLEGALALRALSERLLTARKRGEAVDVGALNTYLEKHPSVPRLALDADGALALTRVARGEPVAAALGAVAEAVASLLVEGDFSLVKQCEHPDCVLWFYDRTKAHKRRWCSMALCGNRHKAAQFRKRNGQ